MSEMTKYGTVLPAMNEKVSSGAIGSVRSCRAPFRGRPSAVEMTAGIIASMPSDGDEEQRARSCGLPDAGFDADRRPGVPSNAIRLADSVSTIDVA